MRQKYSREQIKQALTPYDIGTIQKTKLFTTGIDNTNIYIKTDRDEGVLKIYETYTTKDIACTQFELSLMDKVNQCNLPAPQTYKTAAGEYVSQLGNKPVAYISFLPGDNIYRKQVSLSLIKEIGRAAAKIDKCLQNFQPQGQERSQHYWDVKKFLETKKFLPQLDRTDIDRDVIEAIYAEYEETTQPTLKNCRSGHIHDDIAAHNILARDNKLTAILDFGDAVHSYWIYEIAVMITQLCMYQQDWKSATKELVKAYQAIISLNEQEKSVLYYLVKCRATTMIVVCNGLYYTESAHNDLAEIREAGSGHLDRLIKLGKSNFDLLI
ncbi:MAG: phosphotransferase [Parcubacteria group bacterium]|nr:phosphotransferase [Parcubacteria group bacterium]